MDNWWEELDRDIFGKHYDTWIGLIGAIKAGNNGLMESLLPCHPRLPDRALEHAFLYRRLDMIHHIMEQYGVKPNNEPCARLATEWGSQEAMALVLDSGWGVNEGGFSRPPMLIWSIRKENISAVAWLLARGANPNWWHQTDETPLTFAVQRKNIEIVQFLIQHGADVKRGNLVHAAVNREDLGMLEFLHERGAPLNEIMFENHRPSWVHFPPSEYRLGPPLHWAIRRGKLKIVQALLDKGINSEKQDTKGFTATDVALENDQQEIYQLLLQTRECPSARM